MFVPIAPAFVPGFFVQKDTKKHTKKPNCINTAFNRRNWTNKNKMLDKMLDESHPTEKQKSSRFPEALILLAGVCENRTHQGRDRRPTTGFEDQEGHQAPSTPIDPNETIL